MGELNKNIAPNINGAITKLIKNNNNSKKVPAIIDYIKRDLKYDSNIVPSINHIIPDAYLAEKYLYEWDNSKSDISKQVAIENIFNKVYPNNNNIYEILSKVSMLNDLFSIGVKHQFELAEHILKLDIDSKLLIGDSSLVNEIAYLQIEGQKAINYYTFATKYCHYHNSSYYPIYDSKVEKMLKHFRDINSFATFTIDKLKDYQTFKEVINNFKEYHGLSLFSNKDLAVLFKMFPVN